MLTYICIGSLLLNLVLLARVLRLANGILLLWQRIGVVEEMVGQVHGALSKDDALASLRSSSESPKY